MKKFLVFISLLIFLSLSGESLSFQYTFSVSEGVLQDGFVAFRAKNYFGDYGDPFLPLQHIDLV
jgi:hypothetical protein